MPALRLRAPLALAFACSSPCALAQVAIDGAIQNFDSLVNTGASSALPPGWSISEAGTGALANGQYTAGTGSANSGDTYSFGAAANSERALGAIASGSVVPTIGAQLQNTTGSTLTELLVSFTTEQWRLGDLNGADRLAFAYSTNATSLTTGTWTAVAALDAVSPVTAGTANVALDGNGAGNFADVSASITGLAIPIGATFWVRWSDVNDTGADDGLAIDDVSFGQAVDVPPTVASTAPLAGATVALNTNLTVTFSEAVTVSGSWFALDCGAGTPALVASGGPTAYTLTHAAPLPSGANCTLTVEGDLVQDQDGTLDTMAADHALTFATVVDVAPTLVSTLPAQGAIDVARGADLQVTFSEAVTADAGAFVLECPDGVAIVATASSEDGVMHVIDPVPTLPASTPCVLAIDAAQIADQDGVAQPLAAGATIGFTTAAVAPPVVLSTVPADNATDFPAAGDLVVNFDQNVATAAGAFTLACDTSTGITLAYPASGTVFDLETGTSLADGESCTLHIEADGLTSDDGLHPAADVDVVFAVAAPGPGDYYATVNTSSAGQLRCTLHAVIDGHTKYPYSASTTDTWDILEIADQDPANSARVVDIYRNESYIKHGAGNADYNREHTWPNSLGFPDQQQLAAYTDTHMLYISNDTYNSTRGNTPYGNCTSGCTTLATLATNGRGGTPAEVNKYNGDNIFEVWSGRKGDAARAVMYMAIRYEGGDGTPDLELTNNLALVVGTSQTAQKAYMGKLDDLIAWHQADPPDAQELLRNEAVASFQGNRNPFIDHPEWGTKALFESTTPTTCEPVTGGGNTPPAANDDTYAPTEDTPFVQAFPGVLGNDNDADEQSLSTVLKANVQHGTLALAANGGFTYTPASNYCGPDGFSYQASDGALNSATALVTLNVGCVNDAPVANDANFGVAENSGNGTPVGTVTASDVDAGATLTYAITAGNSGNAFAISNSGAITVANPAALDFETTPAFALTVTVTDNATASDTANVAIALSNVDEGAAQAANDALTVDEDAAATVIDVLDNDSADPDGGALAVTAVGAAQHGTTSFTAADVSYAPSADFCGADEFTYTIGGGAAATVSVTVTCVVDAPEAIGVIADRNVTVDRPLTAFSVAGAFSSPDEAPTFEADGLPAGVAIDAATGEVNGTPTALGAFAVTVRAVNSAGNAQAGFTLTVQGEPIFRDGFEH